jgi:hypothetical protein
MSSIEQSSIPTRLSLKPKGFLLLFRISA